jgi:hypothetical protein
VPVFEALGQFSLGNPLIWLVILFKRMDYKDGKNKA